MQQVSFDSVFYFSLSSRFAPRFIFLYSFSVFLSLVQCRVPEALEFNDCKSFVRGSTGTNGSGGIRWTSRMVSLITSSSLFYNHFHLRIFSLDCFSFFAFLFFFLFVRFSIHPESANMRIFISTRYCIFFRHFERRYDFICFFRRDKETENVRNKGVSV